MSGQDRVSEETVNAYVDNQLDIEEKERVFTELERDEELNRRVCELRKLRDLMQDAYREPPPPARRANVMHRLTPVISRVAAVVLLLAIGATSGWLGHMQWTKAERVREANAGLQIAEAKRLIGLQQNVILHLTNGDPKTLNTALNEAQSLLNVYKSSGKRLQLEIVANDTGLNLLRSDVSPYKGRVEQLIHEYDNVTFMACAKAMQRLKEQGTRVNLLPNTKVVPSALSQIVKRLDQGWLYIKV